jgi:hypothetical protein
LGKGGKVAKDLRINDPTNANIKIHNGKYLREPTANGGNIWIIENRNRF